MEVNNYINRCDLLKKEIEKTLDQISWIKEIPYKDNNQEIQSKKSALKAINPVIGGLGCLSLIGGLVSNKMGFTILGGVVIVGSLLASRKKEAYNPEKECRQVDYQTLSQVIENEILASVRSACDKWNTAITSMHNQINSDVLSSNISESNKTELLSVASEEFPLIISTMDVSVQLQDLEAHEDLAGMEKAINDYKALCVAKLESAWKSQRQVYENLKITLDKIL